MGWFELSRLQGRTSSWKRDATVTVKTFVTSTHRTLQDIVRLHITATISEGCFWIVYKRAVPAYHRMRGQQQRMPAICLSTIAQTNKQLSWQINSRLWKLCITPTAHMKAVHNTNSPYENCANHQQPVWKLCTTPTACMKAVHNTNIYKEQGRYMCVSESGVSGVLPVLALPPSSAATTVKFFLVSTSSSRISMMV